MLEIFSSDRKFEKSNEKTVKKEEKKGQKIYKIKTKC